MNKYQQALAAGKLYTRDGHQVSKLVECRDLSHRLMFEVFSKGCPWCIVTVYASNGKFDVNASEEDRDEFDLVIKE